MFPLILSILASSSFAVGASSQQQMPAASLQPVSNLQYGTYDFANGFTASSGANLSVGPDVLFSTVSGFAYYYGIVGSKEKQEWLEEAQLPNRGLTGEEQINGMAWAYCEGGFTSYFDAFVSIYSDTVACVGPSDWIPGQPSFADCIYSIDGLPGSGCWSVTIQLDCGFECVLPDASNPRSGPQGTIGWSVTPFNTNGSTQLGPLMYRGPPPPGSQPTFEWRDWNGNYFGSYVHGGCYSTIPGWEFGIVLLGAAIDVQHCNGSNSLDVLCLEGDDAVENGAIWHYVIHRLNAGALDRLFLIVQPDPAGTDPGCDQVTMSGLGGSFTRQVAVPSSRTFALGTVSNAHYNGSLRMPMNQPNAHVLFQAISLPTTGQITPSNVQAASNGIDTTL